MTRGVINISMVPRAHKQQVSYLKINKMTLLITKKKKNLSFKVVCRNFLYD